MKVTVVASHSTNENTVIKSTVNLACRRIQPKIKRFRKYNKVKITREIGKRKDIDK